jgi:histidinol dehydrogenase
MLLNRDISRVLGRKAETDSAAAETVAAIIADVRKNGDTALRAYAERFDGYRGESLTVSQDEMDAAVQAVGGDFMRVLSRARDQIAEFHRNQIEKPWGVYKENGVMMGQLVRPIERVALYVPGGTAAYPSTMLMNAVPARLAGVEELAIFTPAKASGRVADVILAAAACCGIKTVYKLGGAQAIAAAAFGTESIPKFDKITGPGNVYVATAKRMVYGEVAIDMVAGPSEVLVIADETANPRYIAADLLSQAEHDVLASAILVTTSEDIIKATERELERQLESLPRREFAEKSLQDYGAAVLVKDLDEAFQVSNGIAPEHLEVMTANPLEHLPKVKNAGSVFLGENTPEPLGDYISGTNHVLPTGGTARFYSPLGVYDFIKRTAYSYYPREALRDFKDDVIAFAELEGLNAHANSIKVRFED